MIKLSLRLRYFILVVDIIVKILAFCGNIHVPWILSAFIGNINVLWILSAFCGYICTQKILSSFRGNIYLPWILSSFREYYLHFVDTIGIGHITSYPDYNVRHFIQSFVLVVDIIFGRIIIYLAHNVRPISHILII